MAIAAGSALKFHFGTLEQFNNAKTAKTIVETDLYFLTDQQQVYLGENLFSGPVELVEALPTTGIKQNILYIDTVKKTGQVYNGTAWISITPNVVSDATTAADADVANVGALKALIAKAVVGEAYDSATQKITFTNFDGTTGEIQLADLITSITYANGAFTIKKLGAEDATISMPADNFLNNAAYDNTTHILTLTLSSGDTVTVNLEDLVDAYSITAKDTSLDVTNTGGAYTIGAKISAASGNALQLNADGLFIQIPAASLETVEDTTTVDMTITGTVLKADVKVSAQAGNQLKMGSSVPEGGTEAVADGLYVAPLSWEEI